MECGGDAFAWTRSLARDSHCLEIPWITSHTIYSCSGSEFDGAPGCAVLVNAQTETGASALNLPTGPVTSYEQLHGNWIKSADCETAGFEGDEGAVNCICQKIL